MGPICVVSIFVEIHRYVFFDFFIAYFLKRNILKGLNRFYKDFCIKKCILLLPRVQFASNMAVDLRWSISWFCFVLHGKIGYPSDDGGLRKIPLVNPLFDLDYFKVGW